MSTYQLMPGRQIIGRAGEAEPITLTRDVTDWKKDYPYGLGGILCTRPDGMKIPLEAGTTGNVLSAVLPDECKALPGLYRYEAIWTMTGQVVETQTYQCILMGSKKPGPPAPPPPDGWVPDWAEEIYARADDAIRAQEAAETSQEAAETAQGKAEDAQEAAETAQDKAEDAQDAAEAARDRAEAAATLAQEHSMGFSFSTGVLTLKPITDD